MWSLLVLVFGILSTTENIYAQVQVPVDVELPAGPVVSSNRVIGLGGAFVGIAEGADGHLFNAASFASRYPYTRNDSFDWDWTLYWLGLASDRQPDLITDSVDDTSSSFLGLGIDFKLYQFGLGFHLNGKRYDLFVDDLDGQQQFAFDEILGGIGFGYTLRRLHLSLGAFLSGGTASFERDGFQLLSLTGTGLNLGALWAPPEHPFRLGAAFQFPLRNENVEYTDIEDLEGLVPSAVVTPAELTLGGSYMLWERKYNPRHTWGYESLPGETEAPMRRYVLFATDLVITAPNENSVSMRSLINGREEPAGHSFTFGVRVGVESEIVANWIRIRGGYYSEPSRIKLENTRHHVTAGADLKVPIIWDLRLNTAIDLSTNYSNFGLGLGFWH